MAVPPFWGVDHWRDDSHDDAEAVLGSGHMSLSEFDFTKANKSSRAESYEQTDPALVTS